MSEFPLDYPIIPAALDGTNICYQSQSSRDFTLWIRYYFTTPDICIAYYHIHCGGEYLYSDQFGFRYHEPQHKININPYRFDDNSLVKGISSNLLILPNRSPLLIVRIQENQELVSSFIFDLTFH